MVVVSGGGVTSRARGVRGPRTRALMRAERPVGTLAAGAAFCVRCVNPLIR